MNGYSFGGSNSTIFFFASLIGCSQFSKEKIKLAEGAGSFLLGIDLNRKS